jgi:outer membrane protein
MNTRAILAAGVAAGGLFALAAAATAQTTPTAPGAAAPAQVQVTHGPPIPGVCIFNEQAALANSLVGKAVATRYQQLVQQAGAELDPQVTSFQADRRALEAARGTLDEPTYEKRAADLNLRAHNLQQLHDQRQQELEYTRQKQLARVGQEIVQVLPGAYMQAKCSLLLDAQAVWLGNPTMDVTPSVITALNARITTLTFDREAPPAQPGGGGGQ